MPKTRRIVVHASSFLGNELGGRDLDKEARCEGKGGGVCRFDAAVFLGL